MAKKKIKKIKEGFNVKFDNGKLFAKMIETASKYTDETQIVVNKKEVYIKSVEIGGSVMIYCVLKKNAWSEYKCDKERALGIDLNDLDTILKRCSVKDQIRLKYEPKIPKLIVQFIGKNTGKTRTFRLDEINVEKSTMKLQKIMDIEGDCEFSLKSSEFNEILKDVEVISEEITITTTDESIKFSAEYVSASCETEIKLDEFETFDIIEHTSTRYGVEFIKRMLPILNIPKFVNLKIKDYVYVEFTLNLEEGVEFYVWLGPRVDALDDDDEDDDYDEKELSEAGLNEIEEMHDSDNDEDLIPSRG